MFNLYREPWLVAKLDSILFADFFLVAVAWYA